MRAFNVFFGLVSFIFCAANLDAKVIISPQQPHHVVQNRLALRKVEQALCVNDYKRVGILLKDNLGTNVTINQLKVIAKEHKRAQLLRALDATLAFASNAELNKERVRMGITRGEFLQMSLFIENNLPWHIQHGQYYLSARQTQLPCAIEHDPESKNTFILLDKYRHSLIGYGSNKVVNKALLYDQKASKIVARALQTETRKNELQVSHAMRGAPGVFEILACTKYNQNGENCRTIYSKLYKTGSLYEALQRHKFSLYEKAKMALTLIVGVDELHKRKYVHRDISTRNCLIEIPSGKPDRRDIKVGLADLGRSEHLYSNIDKTKKVQGHSIYNPPEGIFREDIKTKDFLRSDIFAMGCVLYEIFYSHTPAWQKAKYFRRHGAAADERYDGLVQKLKDVTRKRRNALLAKKFTNRSTPQEDFEYLILHMVHHNKLKRGSAGELRHEMEQIFMKIAKLNVPG